MKTITLYTVLLFLLSCNQSVINNLSAIQLNDSAVALTNHYKDSSKYKQAISLLNIAIKRDSTVFDLYKNKFFFEVSLGEYDSALKTNMRLIEFRPDSADLYFQAGIFQQYYNDTIQATRSFGKAASLYQQTLNTMKSNDSYFFYNWKLWAFSMILVGREDTIHDFLKQNCTNRFDSVIYDAKLLSKSKQALTDTLNKNLAIHHFAF